MQTAHLVQLLLPLRMRDGSEVPPDMFAAVRLELTQRFGGVTAYSRSPATGLWKRTEAEVERDQVIMIEVVVEGLDRDWWAQYREQLEQRFGQEEVHARALPIERI
jgi:hypothetical protein